MQPLDCPRWAVLLDRFRDLVSEGDPVVERLDAQELDQGVEFVDVVLHRRARQTPPILAFECTARNSGFRRLVLDVVCLVYAIMGEHHRQSCESVPEEHTEDDAPPLDAEQGILLLARRLRLASVTFTVGLIRFIIVLLVLLGFLGLRLVLSAVIMCRVLVCNDTVGCDNYVCTFEPLGICENVTTMSTRKFRCGTPVVRLGPWCSITTRCLVIFLISAAH